MDSYATAIQAVVEQHGETRDAMPSWLKASNLPGSPTAPPSARFKEPPPVSPQKALLRGRPPFGTLENVAEEPAKEGGGARNLESSCDGDSARSESDSVETVVYKPAPEAVVNGSSDSCAGERLNGGRSGSSRPTTNAGSHDSVEAPMTKKKAAAQPQALRTSGRDAKHLQNKPLPATPDARAPTSPRSRPSTSGSQTDAGLSPAAQLPHTPGGSTRANALKTRENTRAAEPRDAGFAAIEGMITSLGSRPHQGRPKPPGNSTPKKQLSNTTSAVMRPAKPPAPEYRETERDGVPMVMRQKSDVWVETVGGVALTSSRQQQRNIRGDETIPEREAKDIRDIEISEDPREALPPHRQAKPRRPNEQTSHYVQPPKGYQRQQPTERWAKDQAAQPHDSNAVCNRCHRRQTAHKDGSRCVGSDHAEENNTTHDTRPRSRRTTSHPPHIYTANPAVSPFWYSSSNNNNNASNASVGSNISSNARRPNATSTPSSDSLTAATSASNVSPPGAVLPSGRTHRHQQQQQQQEQRQAYKEISPEMEARIAESAASVEQTIYGAGLRQKSNTRFQELNDRLV